MSHSSSAACPFCGVQRCLPAGLYPSPFAQVNAKRTRPRLAEHSVALAVGMCTASIRQVGMERTSSTMELTAPMAFASFAVVLAPNRNPSTAKTPRSPICFGGKTLRRIGTPPHQDVPSESGLNGYFWSFRGPRRRPGGESVSSDRGYVSVLVVCTGHHRSAPAGGDNATDGIAIQAGHLNLATRRLR
jgi:hypothetical protein